MKVMQFSVYYVRLQLAVMFGIHRTLYPMDIRWRWRFWRENNQV